MCGFIPAGQFFRCLAQRRFPTTLDVRPRAQLDYLPEPDIFHDVFGHVPLHADPVFADVLPDTMCLDPADVERKITTKTKAILGVDVYGIACDYAALYGMGLKTS